MISRSPLDGQGRTQFKLILIRASVGGFIFDPQTKGESPASAPGEVRGEWQRKERRLIFRSSCHGTGGDRCRSAGFTFDPCRANLRHHLGGEALIGCQEDEGNDVVQHPMSTDGKSYGCESHSTVRSPVNCPALEPTAAPARAGCCRGSRCGSCPRRLAGTDCGRSRPAAAAARSSGRCRGRRRSRARAAARWGRP